MTINWTSKALKGMKSLPKRDAEKLLEQIDRLATLPNVGGLSAAAASVGADVTQIKDRRDLFRLRFGNFRAGLRVEGVGLLVEWVEDRKQAYRK